MTGFRAAAASGRVAPRILLGAGAVGLFFAAIALVAAAGLGQAWAAIPASSSCLLFACVGEALSNVFGIPGLVFGTSSVAATVGATVASGGIGGATYGDGLGSGGRMGTEGDNLGTTRFTDPGTVVYDDHGREIPGTQVPDYTDVTPLRTIYAPNGNPMFYRVLFHGNLPAGVPRTGWVEATGTSSFPKWSGQLAGMG